MATLILLTVAVFAVAMSIMAVGVVFDRRCLRGSCGGPEVTGPDGEGLTCAACPRRKEREEAAEPSDGEPEPLVQLG